MASCKPFIMMCKKEMFFIHSLFVVLIMFTSVTHCHLHKRRQIVFENERRYQNVNCLTPNDDRGTCVRWRNCPPLQRLSWRRLLPYQCGFEGDEPLLCCPVRDEDFTTRRTTRRTTKKPTTTTRRPITTTRRSVTSTRRRIVTTSRPVPTTVRFVSNLERPSYLPRTCGISPYTTTRVVNGQVAEPGAWPWMAVVYVEGRGGQMNSDCGGTLVTNRHIITAAHCVVAGRGAVTMSPRQLLVRLGAHDLSKTEPSAVDISVDSVRRHEQFDPRTYKNDIAILRLSRPVQFTDRISPVCLPYDSLRNDDLTSKTSYVTGWGTVSFNGPASEVLREAGFDIQDQEYCRRAYEKELNITEVYLCAGTADGSKDSCQGDSGGPLVTIGKGARYYLVGIVSFGKLCAQPGYPGVYTRVTEFLNWLARNLQD